MRPVRIAVALLLVSGVATSANAEDCSQSVLVTPNEVVWKAPAVSPGVEAAVICGDPSKAGVYVLRARFPAGFKFMPHFHPDEWRTAIVLSGNYYFALGEQWDESKLKPYPAGTFLSEPKGTPHYVWAKDGEVVVQITAMGPTAVTRIPQKQ